MAMRKFVLSLLVGLLAIQAVAQGNRATWIWYPGDFEIWLSNQMQNKRTERGAFFPPFWRQDNHYVLVDFHKEFELAVGEDVELYAEGQYNVKLDGKLIEGYRSEEHTSELQSRENLVCRLLLEKKKNNKIIIYIK